MKPTCSPSARLVSLFDSCLLLLTGTGNIARDTLEHIKSVHRALGQKHVGPDGVLLKTDEMGNVQAKMDEPNWSAHVYVVGVASKALAFMTVGSSLRKRGC